MIQKPYSHVAICAAAALCAIGMAWQQPHISTNGPVAVIPNVQVSHDRYAAHAEPSLAVNPLNPRNLLGAAQLLASTRESAVLGTFVSQDGGRSWHDNGALSMPAGYTHGDDVTVAFTAQGTAVVAAEAYRSGGSAILVWRSVDGGRHFAPPTLVYRMNDATDHPWIAASPTGTHVYLAWSARTTLLFSASADGGSTFGTPHPISDPGEQHPDEAVVTAGSSNIVHVVYAGDRGPFEVVSSSDGGRTFGPPSAPSLAPVATNASTVAVPTLLAAATDPRSGSIYVASTADLPSTRHLDILLWHSSDGGRSWPAPVRVDAEPGADGSDHVQPQLAVITIRCGSLPQRQVIHQSCPSKLTRSTMA
jgi:hypothetical protein